MNTINSIELQLDTAKDAPHKFFGDDPSKIDAIFKEAAKYTHPDVYSDKLMKERATIIFQKLNSLKQEAISKFESGSYGKVAPPIPSFKKIEMDIKGVKYTFDSVFKQGDLSTVYEGTITEKKIYDQVLFKVSDFEDYNDLLINERNRLLYLYNDAPTKKVPAMRHICPKVLDSIVITDKGAKKRINVLRKIENYVSLQDVLDAYPNGIDIRDAVWMYNRLLAALIVTSQARLIHGAIIPSNFLINPETHDGILIDWCFSVNSGNKELNIIDEYSDYYPFEVKNKVPLLPNMDLYMASKVLLKLIGGDIKLNTFPHSIPVEVEGFIRSCFLSQKQRPDDIHKYYTDFNDMLKNVFGPRKFRPFTLPKK